MPMVRSFLSGVMLVYFKLESAYVNVQTSMRDGRGSFQKFKPFLKAVTQIRQSLGITQDSHG
jgi:hypothetical protein